MNTKEYIKCPICESEGIFLMKAKNTHGSHCISDEQFSLVECKECGLVFINPRPTEKEVLKYYNFNYYSSENKIKSKKIEKLLLNHWPFFSKKRVINKFRKKGRILDIGCGNGDFLNSLLNDKWKIYGVEPNPIGYDLANHKILNNNIFNNKLLDCQFHDNYFDVITMWHVFEHIYYPKKELQEIRRILKNGGIFILTMPNVKSIGFKIAKQHWFHLDAPRHLFHYDAKTITKLLGDSASYFKILRIDFIYMDFPLDIYHSIINSSGKNKSIRILLRILVLFFLPLLKLIGVLFKASETMLIVCEKRD